MLSNIASYLLGSNNVNPQVTLEPDVRLVEADEGEDGDGWVVVHKSTEPSQDDADDEILIEVEGEKRNDECEHHKEHHLSVAVSCCASLNNSWFVTPPPCFTSTGPVDLETSPFEDLLIEHPSMSVYQHRISPNTRMYSSIPATIQDLIRATSEPPPEEEETMVLMDVPRNCPTSESSLENLKHQQQNIQKLRAINAQKIFDRSSTQGIKRNQLALRDKAREQHQKRHRPRRCERQPRNCAANNNRKC